MQPGLRLIEDERVVSVIQNTTSSYLYDILSLPCEVQDHKLS